MVRVYSGDWGEFWTFLDQSINHAIASNLGRDVILALKNHTLAHVSPSAEC